MWVTKMYIIINTTGKKYIYTSITQKQKIKKENRQNSSAMKRKMVLRQTAHMWKSHLC